MYHFFINRRRIDWWKNIWYTSISDWCITELFLDWQFRLLDEIGIYQKLAGIVQDGHHSNSVWFRTQCLCFQRKLCCQVAQWQPAHHQYSVKTGNFQNFFIPPPLDCVISMIDVQNFNFAQIDKILKNQTDLFTAFCKIWFPLMWGRYSWCDIKANTRHIEIWRMKTWKIDLLDFTFYAVFWPFCA